MGELKTNQKTKKSQPEEALWATSRNIEDMPSIFTDHMGIIYIFMSIATFKNIVFYQL